MNFERYAAILGFLGMIFSVATFSIKKDNQSVRKVSGIGCFFAFILLTIGISFMIKDGYFSQKTNDGKSSSKASSYEVSSYETTASSSPDDQDEIERIKNNARRVSYIDVYPDSIVYYPSDINMWDPRAGKQLNMRSGPDGSYTFIVLIDDGDDVISLSESKNDYTYVYSPKKNRYGWVLSKYVEHS